MDYCFGTVKVRKSAQIFFWLDYDLDALRYSMNWEVV